MNETAQHGSNYIPPEKARSLTEEEREDASYGSKMTFILEHFTLVSLWLVKACLLIIYNRLTYVFCPVHTITLFIIDIDLQVGVERTPSSEGTCCLRCSVLRYSRDSLLYCLVWPAYHHVLYVDFFLCAY